MAAKRRPRKSEKLRVKRVCGYVAVNGAKSGHGKAEAWMYLRKHSNTQLFIGNIPEPRWSASHHGRNASKAIAEDVQTRLQRLIKLIVPCAEQVGEIFSTGNGRLATRISVVGGENAIDEILQRPDDHVYMEYWSEMHGDDSESLVEKWLKEYEEDREERKVMEWSNAAMKAYEARERGREEEKERRRAEGGVPDEDGFTMVTEGAKQMKAAEAQKVGSGGRAGKGRYKSKSGRNRKALLDVNKGIEKVGFYRWQRDNRNVLVELQKKFREDKKRVAAIRGLEGSKQAGSKDDEG